LILDVYATITGTVSTVNLMCENQSNVIAPQHKCSAH